MPSKSMIHFQSLQTHFEHFKTSLHLAGPTRLPQPPHACTSQWVPIVWCVPTSPLYISASCSTVYKSSPLARESLELSLRISFARLVVLCTYVTYAYKNFRYPLLVLCIMWNIRLPLQYSTAFYSIPHGLAYLCKSESYLKTISKVHDNILEPDITCMTLSMYHSQHSNPTIKKAHGLFHCSLLLVVNVLHPIVLQL